EGIVFPFMVFPFLVDAEKWGKLIDDASLGNKIIGIFWQPAQREEFSLESLAKTGTAVRIVRLMRLPTGQIQLILQGLSRIQIQEIVHTEPYPFAKVQVISDEVTRTPELEGLA